MANSGTKAFAILWSVPQLFVSEEMTSLEQMGVHFVDADDFNYYLVLIGAYLHQSIAIPKFFGEL